jgi:hypothetical protein
MSRCSDVLMSRCLPKAILWVERVQNEIAELTREIFDRPGT